MDKFALASEKMEDNEFINYSPLVFKGARELASISEGSYLVSKLMKRYSSTKPLKAIPGTRTAPRKYVVWEISIYEMQSTYIL